MFARVLLTAAFAAGLALAQGGMGGGDGMGGPGGGMGGGGRSGRGGGDMGADAMSGMPRQQRQTKAEVVADKLRLNKEQKEQFANIVSAGQEEMRPILQQISQGRNVIITAIIQGKSSEEINQLMSQFTDLMAQRTAAEAKAYGKLYAILDPKQQAKAGPVFATEMDALFETRGAGRGGRGRQ